MDERRYDGIWIRDQAMSSPIRKVNCTTWPLSLLKTGNLDSGLEGGGGGDCDGLSEVGVGTRGANEKAVLADGGGDPLPKLDGGDGLSEEEPRPGAGGRHNLGLEDLMATPLPLASSAL